jgi:undecaprenyl-diphosphatase
VAPAALAGYALGDQIERRFGTPGTIAGGLLAGSIAMAAGDLRKGTRAAGNADMNDGLALGLAQAAALVPGVSRSGAAIATARARGFSRKDADRLSWQVGLPVIAGAALLKGSRLAREGVPRELRLPLAAGAASAFSSTLLSAKLLGPRQRALLLPASVGYRAVLAVLVVRRMRDNAT